MQDRQKGEERPRVLLVEDNASTLALQRMMLKGDFEVVAAMNFDEAVSLFDESPCPVALLDIDLGETRSGVDLLRRLRSVPGAENLVAVACTAYALPGSRSKFLGAGFNEYIAKPFTKIQLVETIRKAFRRDAMAKPSERAHQLEIKLPAPPSTFPEIVRMLARNEPIPDTPHLISVLERDPLTVFWVLRHLNSAYYGLRRKVAEIDRAVAMLGYDPVCNLVLTEVVTQTFQDFDSERAQAVYRHVFKTSIAAGAISRHLGYKLDVERPELAFSIGVLHQIGRMALLSSDSERYCNLWEEGEGAELVSPTMEQEAREYDDDYPRIGAEVARAWYLPDDITDTIRYHRDARWVSTTRLRAMAMLVNVGHNEALRLYESPNDDVTRERSALLASSIRDLSNCLRVSEERVIQAIAESEGDVREFVQTFTHEQAERDAEVAV